MKHTIKEYFTFSSRERNGTLILIIIIVVLITINNTMQLFVPEKEFDNTQFEQEINEFLTQLKSKEEEEYVSRLDKYIIERYDTLNLFKFNPNTTSDKEWKQLGLTNKQISNIKNYLERGGTFKFKDDFRKMYGIRTKQYQILKLH